MAQERGDDRGAALHQQGAQTGGAQQREGRGQVHAPWPLGVDDANGDAALTQLGPSLGARALRRDDQRGGRLAEDLRARRHAQRRVEDDA